MASSSPSEPNPPPVAAAPPKVQKTTFTYKSDVRKSQIDARPCCGVLHCVRTSPDRGAGGGREEQSFAWVANYDSVENALRHLERYGFARERVQFLPFSSRTAWTTRYPGAFPYVDCDVAGNVTGFPFWSPRANSASDIPPGVVVAAAEPTTAGAVARSAAALAGARGVRAAIAVNKGQGPGRKSKGGANNRLNGTLLSNGERNELHNEIYGYFSWLADRVAECETSESGRRAVKKADLSAAGLRGLLVKLESTFHKSLKKRGAATGEGKDVDTKVESEEPSASTGEAAASPEEIVAAPFPLLEESLADEMNTRALFEEEIQKRIKAESKAERKKNANWEPLDFEVMYGKLLAYREVHGHPNVPVKYQEDMQLGGWVSGLRSKKKAYDKDNVDRAKDKDGDEGGNESMELDEADAAKSAKEEEEPNDDDASSNNGGNTNHPSQQRYLTPERIRLLESIGFLWTMNRPKSKSKSWDERLVELKEWYDTNGTWKVPRATSLGEWLHNQRTLYGKKDTRFMERRAPRLIEMGYEFDLRESVAVSWEDRFQQLAEWKREHGNFDVPAPTNSLKDGDDEDGEEKYKFYKWVTRLHNEYRAYEKGTSSKLNDERVERLKGIDFQFRGPKSRGRPSTGTVSIVPSLPWEKRLQQMENFKRDTGHLNIDHNYKHCSNLGGWAADMSTLYKNWKAGTQQLSEDMIAKFNQLSALGFRFDILPFYENNRSWEDHYAVLLEFKKENKGSARVPLKYKADLRLGKWVQTQRQQYKQLREGNKSKMTEERAQKLNEAGFEWVVAGSPKEEGGDDEEEELDHVMEL
mmetsp:Transcript_33745/g.81585  ORF Transcript_33745/g.81585 Transcript_33745/m.81585 type:complete len:812 (-) Transcript_33745:178-2613(-)